MGKVERWVLGAWVTWTAAVVAVCLMRDGLSPDNSTRLSIVGFLALNLLFHSRIWTNRRNFGGVGFVFLCSLNALVVEAFYMISRPVFTCLRVDPDTPAVEVLRRTLTDFAFTLPVYVAIFSLFWFLLNRFSYRVSEYVIVFSLAQALGDGNAFFAANPAMLIFAPYVMLNYQAINIAPYLRAREHLPARPARGLLRLLLPLVLIPTLYWFGGAAIIVVGRRFGLS